MRRALLPIVVVAVLSWVGASQAQSCMPLEVMPSEGVTVGVRLSSQCLPESVGFRLLDVAGTLLSETRLDAPYRDNVLRVDVSSLRPSPNTAGAYEIEWTAASDPGDERVLRDRLVIPCPSPVLAGGDLDSGSNIFSLDLVSVDVCQGDTQVSLTLEDASGREAPPIEAVVSPETGRRLEVPLQALAPQTRYRGELVLGNTLFGETRTPVELVTGCGPFVADLSLEQGAVTGTLAGADCHFPVGMRLTVVDPDGVSLVSREETLSTRTPRIELPAAHSFPAGDHALSVVLTSAISAAARFDTPLSIKCVAPQVKDVSLSDLASDDRVNLSLVLDGVRPCLGETAVTVQVADAQDVVVFNTVVSLDLDSSHQTLQFPISAEPGEVYFATTQIDSPSVDVSLSSETSLTYECVPPTILELGFASPVAESVLAAVRLAACNLPARYELMVADAKGTPVARSRDALSPLAGAGYALVPPLLLDRLPEGDYTATLKVIDGDQVQVTAEAPLAVDTQGPTLALLHRGRTVDPTHPVVVASLEELVITREDPSGFLPAPEPFVASSKVRALESASARVVSVSFPTSETVRILGTVELPRSELADFHSLVFQSSSSSPMSAPISITYVPLPTEVGEHLSFETRSIGFVASLATDELPLGDYAITSLEGQDPAGEPVTAPLSAQFSRTAYDSSVSRATLNRGVERHRLRSRVDPTTGHLSMAAMESLYDGSYTLSVVGVDAFGNVSDSLSVIVSLEQDKRVVDLAVPAVDGFLVSVMTPFDVGEPLVAKVVAGAGKVAIDAREISSIATDLRPSESQGGQSVLSLSLMETTVDTQIVIHSRGGQEKPLLLNVRAFAPDVRFEPVAGAADLIRVRATTPQCAQVVVIRKQLDVDELPQSFACAIQFSEPTTVRSSTIEGTVVAFMAPLSDLSLSYELGFLVGPGSTAGGSGGSGVRFVPVERSELSDARLVDLTPEIEFRAAPALAAQSRSLVTWVGPTEVGWIEVRAEHDGLVLEIDGVPVQTVLEEGEIRYAIRTDIGALGGAVDVEVGAYYEDYPEHASRRTLSFVAVPSPVDVFSVGGALVTTNPMHVDLRLTSGEPTDTPLDLSSFVLSGATLVRVAEATSRLPAAAVQRLRADSIRVSLGAVDAGRYRLSVTLRHNGAAYSDLLLPLVTDVEFTVLDGSPILSDIYSFRSEGTVPFIGYVGVQHRDVSRASDLGNVLWEISSDGEQWIPFQEGPRSVDFFLQTPSTQWYRATLLNRHSDRPFTTEPIRLMAYKPYDLSVRGPTEVFREWPAVFTANAPSDHRVTWHLTGPHAKEALVVEGHALRFTPPVTGRYFIECKSVHPDLSESLRTTRRVFRTLTARWPKIPAPVIIGPGQVEPGETVRFTVELPDVFPGGNGELDVVGEWELPDGTRHQSPWVDYTRPLSGEGSHRPAGEQDTILYHAWVSGAKAATFISSAHHIAPWRYRWPVWHLTSLTESADIPAFVRIAIAPETWTDWLDLGDMDIRTAWQLPPNARVRLKSHREVILELPNDRPFAISALVSDSRGNSARLSLPQVHPLRTSPFEVALRLQPERELHTAPISLAASADAVLLPRGDRIERTSFLVDDFFVGTTDGASLELDLRTAGVHRIRVIATTASGHTAEAVSQFEVGENHPADCQIVPIGDLRITGVAKAECDDPDGEMVRYEWFANGQPVVGAGPRVQIPSTDTRYLRELILVATDSGGVTTRARLDFAAGE